WEKRLAYELLADLLNDKDLEEAKSNVTRRYERLRRTLRDTEAHEVQEVFLSSFSKLYDPHSSFLSASTLEDFSIQMQLSLVGIGAQLLSEDGYCTIKELIPGGPAALDLRLKPNDRIVAVAQDGEEPVDVIDMKLRHVVEMIRGEKGTTVHLTVIPAEATDSSVRRTISLVRDEIRLTASRARATGHEVPGEDGQIVPVGVIEVPSFYGSVGSERPGHTKTSTTDDVRELIGVLKEAGIEALVLDFRRNGGGLLTEAIRLTGLFIESGPVVQVKSSNGDLRVDPDKDPSVAYSGPLGILVSRNSASASEIVAGALKSYNRALILGESSTHGKGTVQAIYELKNYLFRSAAKTGAAKLTVQKFYLPDGQSTQNRGVVPHIVFPSFNDYLPVGEADLPNALAWDTIPVGNWEEERDRFPIRSPLESDLITRLQKRSEARQQQLEEFQYLRGNIEWLRERQEQNSISLNLEERRTQKELDEEFREKMKATEKRLAQDDFDFEEFTLDSVDEPEVATVELDLDADSDVDSEESSERSTLDIHLRESLRILADLVDLGDSVWAVTAQKAENSK
ncbi:MAG TPA: carboxy terminal-processing peptidase, partial [Opitutales bacterium]|nr:carboxy terminal-processing peptidase [Opitutales bacterium]